MHKFFKYIFLFILIPNLTSCSNAILIRNFDNVKISFYKKNRLYVKMKIFNRSSSNIAVYDYVDINPIVSNDNSVSLKFGERLSSLEETYLLNIIEPNAYFIWEAKLDSLYSKAQVAVSYLDVNQNNLKNLSMQEVKDERIKISKAMFFKNSFVIKINDVEL